MSPFYKLLVARWRHGGGPEGRDAAGAIVPFDAKEARRGLEQGWLAVPTDEELEAAGLAPAAPAPEPEAAPEAKPEDAPKASKRGR